MAKPRLALHWQILIGMFLGLVAGIAVNLAQEPIAEAIAAADAVVLFVGLDGSQEAEGHDKTSLLLPGTQACDANPNHPNLNPNPALILSLNPTLLLAPTAMSASDDAVAPIPEPAPEPNPF